MAEADAAGAVHMTTRDRFAGPISGHTAMPGRAARRG